MVPITQRTLTFLFTTIGKLYVFKIIESHREKHISFPLIYSRYTPAARAGLKLTAELSQVSCGWRNPGSWAITSCLPGDALAESWNWQQSQNRKPGTLIWVEGMPRNGWILTPNAQKGPFTSCMCLYMCPVTTCNLCSLHVLNKQGELILPLEYVWSISSLSVNTALVLHYH